MADRALTIERLYQQMELELLVEVAKLIKAGDLIDETTNVVHWKAEKLKDMGTLNHKQMAIISKYADKTVDEVQKLVSEIGIEELDKSDKQLEMSLTELGKDYVAPTNATFRVISALVEKAANDMNLINSSIMRGTRQIYRDIINKSAAEVTAGRRSLYDATIRTIKQWAEKGVPIETGTVKPFKSNGPELVSPSGRTYSAEGYVAMTLRTTQKAVAVSMLDARLDEYDIDLVETSSHLGSRPTHIPFQGRIYSRSGRDPNYPPLSSTGYGNIDGMITGINCRHQMYPYVEGVSTQRYTPYDAKKSLEEYKESQEQRKLERNIRRIKREIETLKATGAKQSDIDKARQTLKDRQKRMRDFIEDTGRTRRPQRERIAR